MPDHDFGNWRHEGYPLGCIISSTPTGIDDIQNVESYGGHLVCESVAPGPVRPLLLAAPLMLRALRHAESRLGALDPDPSNSALRVVRVAIRSATTLPPPQPPTEPPMQSKPRIAPLPERNHIPTASNILYSYAVTAGRLAEARAEVERLEAEDARHHGLAREVFAANGNPREVTCCGEFLIRRDDHGNISAIRQRDVPSTSDMVAPFLDREPDGDAICDGEDF